MLYISWVKADEELIIICRAEIFTCFRPLWRRKRLNPLMLVVLALPLTNGKKMLKTKHLVPGMHELTKCVLLYWFSLKLLNTICFSPVHTTGTRCFLAQVQWQMPSLKNTTPQKAKFWIMWVTLHCVHLYFYPHSRYFWSLIHNVLSSSAGVKGKCCCEDGSRRDADRPGDSTVPAGQWRQFGFL